MLYAWMCYLDAIRTETPQLRDRRRQLRLTFLFKVVEGMVPAIPPEMFLTPKRPRRPARQLRSKIHH